jgi:hypothetical protein
MDVKSKTPEKRKGFQTTTGRPGARSSDLPEIRQCLLVSPVQWQQGKRFFVDPATLFTFRSCQDRTFCQPEKTQIETKMAVDVAQATHFLRLAAHPRFLQEAT